jgi:hypothetical protein
MIGGMATLASLIGFSVWARHIKPPLPWWIIAIVGVGFVSFYVFFYLAYDLVRVQKAEAEKQVQQLKVVTSLTSLDKDALHMFLGTVTKPVGDTKETKVSYVDHGLFMNALMMQMLWRHGHTDHLGIMADHESGVPLNKIIEGKCTVCGKPRNEPRRG